MKNPPGYGSIVDLGKNRRKPIAVRIPNGKKLNRQGKEIISYKYLGYFERTAQGKRDAQLLLAQYNSGANIHIPKAENSCPVFKELADIWLQKHLEHLAVKKGSASAQLGHSYAAAISKCRAIHNKKINCIKYQDIQDIADSIAGMSGSSVANIKTVLFETFDLARKQRYITENFINDVDFLYRKKENKIHSSFSKDEVSLLWKNSDDKNIRIILVMIYTGVRIEELLSMKTENIHLDEKYMIGGVKTDAGKNRIIPVADKIYDFVSELYCAENKYLLTHDGKRYSRTIFMREIWNPAMQLLDINHLPHDTRYTCASMMDRANANENSKKTILGHAKKGVTNSIYVEKELQDLLDAINLI